ncbi:class I SAM-dependent methyltransferase [Sanguibacter sp. 25GB23B1]|uniref:class I SAM-dependent methyltransferase n=1 Tax=unclassified Sanguibacter TaxID=2645534 RepID=UPI0032AFC8D1
MEPRQNDHEAAYWDQWNALNRETGRGEVSVDQGRVVRTWLGLLGRRDLRILEVGCGAGWFVDQLVTYGEVTGVDISSTVLERARLRTPQATFITGDVMDIDLAPSSFDVVIGLEVLSHVADHEAFVRRLAEVLVDDGHLFLATQNRPVLQDHCTIPPAHPDARRKWFSADELVDLVTDHFSVQTLRSVTPTAHHGYRHYPASPRIRRALERTLGTSAARAWSWPMERAGWGFTLMLHARKTPTSPIKEQH